MIGQVQLEWVSRQIIVIKQRCRTPATPCVAHHHRRWHFRRGQRNRADTAAVDRNTEFRGVVIDHVDLCVDQIVNIAIHENRGVGRMEHTIGTGKLETGTFRQTHQRRQALGELVTKTVGRSTAEMQAVRVPEEQAYAAAFVAAETQHSRPIHRNTAHTIHLAKRTIA